MQGLEDAGGLEWEMMDPKSFRTVGNSTSV